jgi:hypothetical protein
MAYYSLAMFPVMCVLHLLNKNLLCSRPLPWPDFLPFLQTPWYPPWHIFFTLFPASSNLTAWTYHSDLI